MSTRNEHTIAVSCSVSGRGYWSGQPVTVTCHPAPVKTGIVFVRADLPGRPECPANSSLTDAISFRTNLRRGHASFAMIEHLMAALYGLEIDNCFVEVNCEELPGLDGSSLAYVEALQTAGLVIQASPRRTLVIDQTVRVELGDAYIMASPHQEHGHGMVAEYQLDYSDQLLLRRQSHRCDLSPRMFGRQIAPARTFVTLQQAEQLRASGVASHVTNRDLLVIGPDGPVDNSFRFRNECARHKLLDLIGDLSIAGVDLVGDFVSHRGGHKLNAMMAQQLSELAAAQSITSSIPHLHSRGNRVQGIPSVRSQRRAA